MFANFILPLAIEGTFTYNIPDEMVDLAHVGMRALLPVGNKIFTGIMQSALLEFPEELEGVKIKDVICFLDKEPVLTKRQLDLWQWLSAYYLCSVGEVMKAALPAVFKLESETRISVNKEVTISLERLSATQRRILTLLADSKPREVRELGKIMGIKSVAQAIKRLIDEEYVLVEENVKERLVGTTERFYSLTVNYLEENQFRHTFLLLKNAPKQREILQQFCQEQCNGGLSPSEKKISRKVLSQYEDFSESALKGLVEKEILKEERLRINEPINLAGSLQKKKELNPFQQEALSQIKEQWRTKDVVLLHGVTSSGKTEVYIHLIEEILARGKQVLYLVPEIALTAQLSERLSSVFGKQLGVYHSRLSERERGEIYHRLQHGEIKLLLGVRSALFLAFRELGLIIVDEEHDSSYKQQDTSPRYHARTVAFYLARLHGAKVLLGSATPSIESYYNAMQGKIGLVKLMHRHNDAPLPHISLVDLKENYRRKEMNGHFAWSLIEKIKEQTGKHKQVIIFQNRRGYASQIECKQCGYVPKCVNCDVTLTVHQHQGKLVCHYCGYTIPIPVQCPSCGAGPLFAKGFGTEQIEDEVKTLFPEAKVVRMDLDTTRRKNAYQQILDGFANHEADVLIGTQMVSKGLHFPDVSLVAVLNADNLMNQPSFRSYEYAFQQLEQVSGRAGRQGCEGEVYIQTYQLDNPVFQQIIKHDYVAFYQQQIKERKLFKYPPFYRLLEVYIRHRDMRKVEVIASALQQQLFQVFGRRCSSVITPVISKLYNQYERRIMLKIEISGSFAKAKELLSQCIKVVRELPDAKAAIVFTDVEPL
ncbi:MAG TPA: primosomal protein N' [Bacteroidales bacterium]|nr:primosomal protein N' [Bacteroidales bacterium]